jgi:Tfp pilus assembly protein PilF
VGANVGLLVLNPLALALDESNGQTTRGVAPVEAQVTAARKRAAQADSKPALSDRLIIPGERIGSLRLAGTIDDIIKNLGPGRDDPYARWGFAKSLAWDAMGVHVEFSPSTRNVLLISTHIGALHPWLPEFNRSPWAEYFTSGGIGLGSTRENVVSSMGSPERTVTSGGVTSLYYDRRGIRLTLDDTGLRRGKVGLIRIIWPSVPRGDSLIVPGGRISNIEVGMAVGKALSLLGGGYHKDTVSHASHYYYWPHLGLSLGEFWGYVNSVGASRDNPSDASGIHYATADKIGLGDSMWHVEQIFGEPSRTQITGDRKFSTYNSRGISFMFDNARIVRAINVSRARGTSADFDQAIAVDPNNIYAYYSRGLSYQNKEDLDRAIADFDKVLELEPKYAPAHNDRGLAYAKKGDFDRAIDGFNKAIELDPKLTSAYINRSDAYGEKGDHDRAIGDLTELIKLDPENAATYYNNRAMALLMAGKAAQGLSDVQKALELQPDQPFFLDTRGHIFEQLGRRKEAIADYRRALLKMPQLRESEEALKRLGEPP